MLQDNASPPAFFERRRVRLAVHRPLVASVRGSEAPQGAGAERRTQVWPPYGWAGPSAEGPPASDVGRRASRRFTAAFERRERTRISSSGRTRGTRHFGICACAASDFTRGRVVMPGGQSPGAARERGYKSRPQGRTMLRLWSVSGRRPT